MNGFFVVSVESLPSTVLALLRFASFILSSVVIIVYYWILLIIVPYFSVEYFSAVIWMGS